MAAVSINQGMPGPEESVHTVDRSRWQLLAMARRQWAEIDLPHDCRLLRTVVDEAPMLAEGLGMESGDQFLTDYLSLDLDLVGRVLGWLTVERPTEAVTLAHADRSSQPEVAEVHATTALDLTGTFAKAGRPSANNPDIVRINGSEGGNSAAYLAARLKKAGRDDLLEQVGPDKPYRSMRAAAIEAGIIKPVPSVRLVDDADQIADSIVAKLGKDRAMAVAVALAELLRDVGVKS